VTGLPSALLTLTYPTRNGGKLSPILAHQTSAVNHAVSRGVTRSRALLVSISDRHLGAHSRAFMAMRENLIVDPPVQ
jgi:hypothetical protein